MHKWPWPLGSLSITNYRNLGRLTFVRTGQPVDKCSTSLLPNWEMLLAKQFPLFKDGHEQLSRFGSAGGWRVYLRVTGLFYGFICGQTDPANQFWQMVSSPSQFTSQHVILRTLALHWNDHFLSGFDWTTDLELMLRVWQTFLLVSSGSYGVILDERHYRDLLMQHVVPPVAKVSNIVLEKLVRSYWNMQTWGFCKNSRLHDFVMLTTSV